MIELDHPSGYQMKEIWLIMKGIEGHAGNPAFLAYGLESLASDDLTVIG